MKKTLDVVKEIIGRAKLSKDNFPKIMIMDGHETFDQEKIAERFNKFFVNIGSKLA